MNPSGGFLVCLFSEPNFLAINLLENLLANNCYVNIFSDNTEDWIKRTSHIAFRDKFFISNYRNYKPEVSYRYVICTAGYINKNNAANTISSFLSAGKLDKTKTLVVLPKEVYKETSSLLNIISDSLGIIYTGDLLGPRIDLESNLKISTYINSIISKKQLVFPVGEIIYPLFVSDVSKQIVKWLFAFGPYGKETFLLGPETSSSQFWGSNATLITDVKLLTSSKNATETLPRNVSYFRVNGNLKYMLSETYGWIAANHIKASLPKVKSIGEKNVGKTKQKHPVYVNYLIKLLIAIMLIPFVFVTLSAGTLCLSFGQFKNGREVLSNNLFKISGAISNISYIESGLLEHIPLVGTIYSDLEYLSSVLSNTSEIGMAGIPLSKSASQLLDNILGKEPYSIGQALSGSKENVYLIHENITLLNESTLKALDNNSLAAKYIASKIDFDKYEKLLFYLTTLIEEAPEILGVEESKTYLVLFQNNMELRPTGGFIGSYGLISFDSGRLSDFVVSDVYSADGQLNGHVEPPSPIKEYLGEANWWLRDSNWDPDFPTSAKRAEWFLEKEIDQKVDGVLAIDLYLIKDFLNVSDEIYLADYDLYINTNNLYEKVQSEVQDNFFPGTHKKASFLTALSRSILDKVGNLSAMQKNTMLKYIYKNLDKKHIQLFFHNSSVQWAFNGLNWDGSVFIPACGQDCYTDFIGIIEANVGVNKANYFVSREVSGNIELQKDLIKSSLTLTLKNSANINLGPTGRYKNYIRLLIPETAANIDAKSTFGQSVKNEDVEISYSKGYKEAGVIIEVLPGESKQVTFNWIEPIPGPVGKYNLYFRKQAGVDDYPVIFNVKSEKQIFSSYPVFSLTEDGVYHYNTTLAKDLLMQLTY